MTNKDSDQRRLAKLASWVIANPGDATVVVVVALTIVLVVLELFGATISITWIIAAIVALASTLSISFIVDRQQQRRTNESVELISAGVTSLTGARSVREVSPKEITPNLARMLDNASTWTFKGGSGRWQRSTVLPRLASISSRTVPYRMQLIDPFNAKLCSAYGEYRTIQRGGLDLTTPDTGEQISLEVLACIFGTAWYARHSRLQPTISLVNTFSPLRLDAGGDGLLITVSDLQQSALYASNASWYYESVIDEFEQIERHGGKLELPKSTRLLNDREPSDAKNFFEALIIENTIMEGSALDSYRHDHWQKVVKLAFQ